MRLLETRDANGDEYPLRFREFIESDIPDYAILSHTWLKPDEGEEVLFAHVQDRTATSKAGYSKIKLAIRQARKERFDYVWVDTCCIDKSSSAELSEAINSMFRWYRNAGRCYAYLADVTVEKDGPVSEAAILGSKWFTRGWTLQELVAPYLVDFYTQDWTLIGDKRGMRMAISRLTHIEDDILTGHKELRQASIANRMSWAAKRSTTREEDRAYSLLGIFDVNMPLLYGEGGKAFIRLQEEIMQRWDDHSLFAWRDSGDRTGGFHGLLADSPKAFMASFNQTKPWKSSASSTYADQ